MEYIIWALFWAFICSLMAKARGRNEALGLLAGLLFTFLAAVYYLAAGDSDEKRFAKYKNLDKQV